jgi:hypothetical protein
VIKIGSKKAVNIVKKGRFLGASTRLQKSPVSFVMSVIQSIENSSPETDIIMLKPVSFMN